MNTLKTANNHRVDFFPWHETWSFRGKAKEMINLNWNHFLSLSFTMSDSKAAYKVWSCFCLKYNIFQHTTHKHRKNIGRKYIKSLSDELFSFIFHSYLFFLSPHNKHSLLLKWGVRLCYTHLKLEDFLFFFIFFFRRFFKDNIV